MRTAVGAGLFAFGYQDGPADGALFQHPLGVTALPDGSLAVSDTYNHALRRYDPATGEVTTLATDLREPSGAVVVGEDVVVVESARHRLTRLRLPAEVSGSLSAQRSVTEVAVGPVHLDVVFTPPPGQRLDTRDGPATRLLVSASPPTLLRSGRARGVISPAPSRRTPPWGRGCCMSWRRRPRATPTRRSSIRPAMCTAVSGGCPCAPSREAPTG